MNSNIKVIVVIGTGGIGQAIARRQGAGMHIVLADYNEMILEASAKDLKGGGFVVSTKLVDVTQKNSVRELAEYAANIGAVTQVVNTAGLSPNMAPAEKILEVDLYGTAVVFEEFGRVIAPNGSGLVISSMAGYMFPPLTTEQNFALATEATENLLKLPFIQSIKNPGVAYGTAKRANHLRVQAEALKWAERGARVNSISPGIILTALAQHEMNSPIGAVYKGMIENSPSKRIGTPDEIATLAAYLLGSESSFITGSDFLIDGGVIAAMQLGKIKLQG